MHNFTLKAICNSAHNVDKLVDGPEANSLIDVNKLAEKK